MNANVRCTVQPIDHDDYIIRTIAAIIRQGKISVVSNASGTERCVYRAHDGSACAAGMWIDDSVYENGMECGTLKYLLEKYYGKFAAEHPFLQYPLTTAWLQAMHDNVGYHNCADKQVFVETLHHRFNSEFYHMSENERERLWGLAVEFSIDGEL